MSTPAVSVSGNAINVDLRLVNGVFKPQRDALRIVERLCFHDPASESSGGVVPDVDGIWTDSRRDKARMRLRVATANDVEVRDEVAPRFSLNNETRSATHYSASKCCFQEQRDDGRTSNSRHKLKVLAHVPSR